jgi:hypothetical protein
MEKYLRKEIDRDYLQEVPEVGKAEVFDPMKEYRRDSLSFSIRYIREQKTGSIPKDIKESIFKELKREKKLIQHKDIPTGKRKNGLNSLPGPVKQICGIINLDAGSFRPVRYVRLQGKPIAL